MSAYQEYLAIINRHNITGDFANVLAELLAYYSENYLADIAAGYYNSSVLKALNEDSLMQLALDHAVPVFRGTNPYFEFYAKLREDAPVDYLYLQPLQEIYSYGTSFFYVGNFSPIIIQKEQETLVRIIYSNKAKRVINYRNPKNEIFIVDDQNVISEHIAFYLTQVGGNSNTIFYYPYTNLPYLFWGFISSEYIDDLTQDERARALFHILVLTMPKWGINVRFSRLLHNEIADKNAAIRLEYLNYTPDIAVREHINKLTAHIRDKMYVEITSLLTEHGALQPDNSFIIRRKIYSGAKFNGIVRSVIDYEAILYDYLKAQFIDSKLYHMKTSPDTSGFVTINYLFVFIPSSGYDTLGFLDDFNYFIKKHFARNLPHIPVMGHTPGNAFYSSPYNMQLLNVNYIEGGFVIMPASPIIVRVYYRVVTIDNNMVQKLFSSYLNTFTNKIIERIDPNEWLTYLSKIGIVEKVDYFAVSIVSGEDMFEEKVYEMAGSINEPALILIDVDRYFGDAATGQLDLPESYFRYIAGFELYPNGDLRNLPLGD